MTHVSLMKGACLSSFLKKDIGLIILKILVHIHQVMNNKKYFNVVLLLIIGTFIIIAIIWLKWRFDELQMQQNAETMIRTIDSIKNETGFYPDNLMYLESDSGIGPFYEKLTDSTYRIIYTIGFDDYYEYRSINKTWQYFP